MQRPLRLRGISGVDDNAAEFLAQVARGNAVMRVVPDEEGE